MRRESILRTQVDHDEYLRSIGARWLERKIAETIAAHQDSGYRVGAGHAACTCGLALYESFASHQAEMVVHALEEL